MKKLLTTKGTNTQSIVMACVGAIIDVIFIIWMCSFFSDLPSYQLKKMTGLMIFEILVVLAMVLWTVRCFGVCQSYVDVYEDRMEGKAVQNLVQIREFRLRYDQITNITYRGLNVYIHTPGGKYMIITNAATAKEIFELYSRMGVR